MSADNQAPALRAVEQWSTRIANLQSSAAEQGAKNATARWNGMLERNGKLAMRTPTLQDWAEYSTDLAQRWLIFLDILRKRGNQYFEHDAAGNPPVLVYQHETLIDGRRLERPANYALLRIVPPEGMKIDADKRPFVIVDPRAGHGPGIGGFKEDSEVGEALRAGHAVYFVSFFPDPVPGQTLGDVAAAEEVFLKEVAARHPKAGKPVVVGNCQGGWAVMALAATRPGLTGPIVINGSPMSYWAGASGKNPMRYAGGMLGGTWMSQLAADLGNGKFDGAHLVQNFENLDLANTYWKKLYNVFANADTEEGRFLEFERWWGGHYFMNAQEIRTIVDELFVGNRLASGRVMTAEGRALDLSAIRAPVVVFASEGDNITPPEQALNWIADVYGETRAIVANGQVIVYLKHLTVGHLGIFVSGKVAVKEHRQIVSLVEQIERLAPGLYEMILRQKGTRENPDYEIVLENREIADIVAADRDSREDEAEFQVVANLSEINARAYDAFVGPLVRNVVNETTAEMGRQLHPARSVHYWLSDRNPWLRGLPTLAAQARAERRAVSKDNPLLAWQEAFSENVATTLDAMRDARDTATELMFYGMYGWLRALGIGASQGDAAAPAADALAARSEEQVQEILARIDRGGVPEAVTRALVMAQRAQGFMLPARAVEAVDRLVAEPEFAALGLDERRRLAHEQLVMVAYAPDRAEQTLAALLPSEADRRRAREIIHRVLEGAQLDPRFLETLTRLANRLQSPAVKAAA